MLNLPCCTPGDILQVEMTSSHPPRCPISLDSPCICPQVTQCGHVFSFPYLAQHLTFHGGDRMAGSAPCPLCFSQVTASELRSLSIRDAQPLAGPVDLLLVRRPRGSILGAPASQPPARNAAAAAAAGPGDLTDPGMGLCSPFNKFSTTADPRPVLGRDARALAEFAARLMAEGDDEADALGPCCFAALDALCSRAAAWVERRSWTLHDQMEQGRPGPLLLGPLDNPQEPVAAGEAARAFVQGEYEDCFQRALESLQQSRRRRELEHSFPALALGAAGSTASAPAPPPPPPPPPAPAPSPVAAELDSPSVYFYQSRDGQNAFLNGLDMRVLLAHYKAPECLPLSLTARLLEAEQACIADEASRRRLATFDHLPTGSQLQLLELDLAPLLPPEALAPFAEELAARERRRRDRAKAEERRRRKEEREAQAREIDSRWQGLLLLLLNAGSPRPLPPSIAERCLPATCGSGAGGPAVHAGPALCRGSPSHGSREGAGGGGGGGRRRRGWAVVAARIRGLVRGHCGHGICGRAECPSARLGRAGTGPGIHVAGTGPAAGGVGWQGQRRRGTALKHTGLASALAIWSHAERRGQGQEGHAFQQHVRPTILARHPS